MRISSIYNSGFLKSPHFIEIKQVIDAYKGKRPLTQIYELIKQVDKDIPKYATFVSFMRKYERSVKEMRQELAKDIMDESLKDIELISIGINKAMRLGNMVMAETFKEIKEKMDNGEKISWQERREIMNWYRGASEMYYEGAALKLKERGDERESMTFSLLAKAARAGTLKGESIEFIEGEWTALNEKQTNANQEPISLPSETLSKNI